MNSEGIGLILFILGYLIISIILIIYGIKWCKKDNAWGLVLLFISMINFLGLLIGGIILYNNKKAKENETINKEKKFDV